MTAGARLSELAPAWSSVSGRVSIRQAVQLGVRTLQGSGTETPALDAEVLMGFLLGWERSRLFAHWDEEIQPVEAARFEALIERRRIGVPVAYIRQRKEFLGREFFVDERVLIPRPETEHLVALALAWLSEHSGVTEVVDVGVGSGAVAISLALARPDLTVTGVDVSASALAVAGVNARRHEVVIRLVQGSLLAPVEGQVDLIVANLPYLSQEEYESLQGTSINFEPSLALTDGADGLALYRDLFAQVPVRLRPGGALLLEFGFGQQEALLALAQQALPSFALATFSDYAGVPRVLQLGA